MTLPIARELARYGIRVMAIAPGPPTRRCSRSCRTNIREALEAQIPFPQRLGRPEEFAALVAAHRREPVPERRSDPARRWVANASALMPALDGMRAVSLAVNVPGPTAAARLAALGASVTKIEPPGGDPLAAAHPCWYDELRSGQRVLTLDLKQAADQAILDELLEPADLLLTSSRPAALARLGLAWPALHARFPRLCQVAIVGYPAPDQDRAGPRPHVRSGPWTRRASRPAADARCRPRRRRSWRRPPRSRSCSPASATGRPGMRRSPSPTLRRRSRRRSATGDRGGRPTRRRPPAVRALPGARGVDRRRRARAAVRAAAGHGARPRRADSRCARDRLPRTQRRGLGSLGTRARHPARRRKLPRMSDRRPVGRATARRPARVENARVPGRAARGRPEHDRVGRAPRTTAFRPATARSSTAASSRRSSTPRWAAPAGACSRRARRS